MISNVLRPHWVIAIGLLHINYTIIAFKNVYQYETRCSKFIAYLFLRDTTNLPFIEYKLITRSNKVWKVFETYQRQ